MNTLLQALWRNESGQDLAEYGFLVVLIAVAVIGALTILGAAIEDRWVSGSEGLAEALSDS